MVADVVTRPTGIVQVPPAVVQYSNLIEPTLPVVGRVKSNWCLTTPVALEPASVAPATKVSLRLVIWAASAVCPNERANCTNRIAAALMIRAVLLNLYTHNPPGVTRM